MKISTFILATMALSGCSTAGPYVTNISSDGNGGITVEKCMVKLNAFLGVVSNAECTSSSLRLSNSHADNTTENNKSKSHLEEVMEKYRKSDPVNGPAN